MSLPKKIIIASGTAGTEASGQATFIQTFMTHWRQTYPEITTALVVYGRHDGVKDSVHTIGRGAWRFFKYILRLLSLRQPGAILFAQDLISSGAPAMIASYLTSMPLVLRLGGDFLWERMLQEGRTTVPLQDYYNQKKNLKEKIFIFVYRCVLGRARMIVFNTSWQRDLYCNIFHIDPKKTTVVENVIELVPYTETLAVKKSDEFTFLFIGRFIAMKNLRRLIQSFRQVSATNARLVLYGYGPELGVMKEISSGDQRITIAGPLLGEEKYKALDQADVIVNVSVSDIHPHFVLEALAHGKPVILTKYSYLPEMIKQACQQVDPLDLVDLTAAMERYMREEELQKAQKRVVDLHVPADWPGVIRAYERIFSL